LNNSDFWSLQQKKNDDVKAKRKVEIFMLKPKIAKMKFCYKLNKLKSKRKPALLNLE